MARGARDGEQPTWWPPPPLVTDWLRVAYHAAPTLLHQPAAKAGLHDGPSRPVRDDGHGYMTDSLQPISGEG